MYYNNNNSNHDGREKRRKGTKENCRTVTTYLITMQLDVHIRHHPDPATNSGTRLAQVLGTMIGMRFFVGFVFAMRNQAVAVTITDPSPVIISRIVTRTLFAVLVFIGGMFTMCHVPIAMTVIAVPLWI